MSEGEHYQRLRESESVIPATAVTRRKPRSPSRSIALLAMLMVLVVAVGYGIGPMSGKLGLDRVWDVVQGAPADSDGDGLPNDIEKAGWTTPDGGKYRTDSEKLDTDADGLTDGDEAGSLVRSSDSENAYAGYSNPLLPDTDDDGLGDADEADFGLDPFDRDSDDDQLEDGPEVEVVGTSPVMADTDGDGFKDGYEETNKDEKGLDPLLADVKVSKMSYAKDYAIGLTAGDAWRKDSFAWLAGNLSSGGSSSIPVIGWVVGALADTRDALASAIRGDWVGSGFSAVGVFPYAGDAVAIPGKAAKFVARNPEMAGAVAAAIAAINKVPEKIKVEAARAIWRGWDELRTAGFSDKTLLQLSKGATNLDDLADATKRSNHVPGALARFFKDGPGGEAWLTTHLKNSQVQVSVKTDGCVEICNKSNLRVIDNLHYGVAHESKVGFKYLTPELEKQIRSDAHLIELGSIKGAHWHFFASEHTNKLGAQKKVLDLLDEVGIPYTIHSPA